MIIFLVTLVITLLKKNMFYSQGKACSSLFFAAHYGCKDIAELLIAMGAKVNTADDKGLTPLHVAATQGHQNVVELLVANGAQIDVRAGDGSTPLYLAARGEHREIAQLLLDNDAVMEPDIAVMLGDVELVKYYLAQGIDANSKLTKGLSKGDSWLITAIGYKHKNTNLIELLLNHGAKVNEKTGTFNFSPLHRVAIVGYKSTFVSCRDIGEILIAHGANVNAEDKHGNTPLHWAARLGHQDIVEILLEYNANVNHKNQGGVSALSEAIQSNHRQVVEYLLSRNAQVNSPDNDSLTPLLLALNKPENEEIIRLLIAYDADVNARDSKGFSPLHRAVIRKNKNMVELLLAHGAREGLE
jgi:ankyrin repeat protein